MSCFHPFKVIETHFILGMYFSYGTTPIYLTMTYSPELLGDDIKWLSSLKRGCITAGRELLIRLHKASGSIPSTAKTRWWLRPVNHSIRGRRQEDQNLKAVLDYTASLRLSWAV